MLKRLKADEVLVIRILLDLVNKFTICKTHSLLQDHGTDHHSGRFGSIARAGSKHGFIEGFPGPPGQLFCQLDPPIIWIQLHSACGIEIDETELFIAIIA